MARKEFARNSQHAPTGPSRQTQLFLLLQRKVSLTLLRAHHGYGCSCNRRADRHSRDDAGQRRAHVYGHDEALPDGLHVLSNGNESGHVLSKKPIVEEEL